MRTTANGRQRRIRIGLRLDPVVPLATDILPSRLVTAPSPSWSLTFTGPTGDVPLIGESASKIVRVVNGAELRGVITDWGGVLTTPILTMVQAWIEADGIDWDSYRTVMRAWIFDAYHSNGTGSPVHALERGECSGAEFERLLAAELLLTDGGPVAAEGLLQRMFAASAQVPAMYDMLRAVRGAGFRTALLSNSWGGHEYPWADFRGLFDTVVISGECGMRKPEEAIFLHTAKGLGLEPEQCVFIDDLEANVAAAAACGMTGVHHTEAAQTVAELQDLLGIPLGSGPGNTMR
jgi:putative hydrolase of the HAD superfamily